MIDNTFQDVLAGLNTYSVSVPSAGIYEIRGNVTHPTAQDSGLMSSVVVTVNQNSSPIYTGIAGARGFRVNALCALNDTLSVVLSSSAPVDQGLNVIKTTIAISQEF
jgi:hypothetical protein